ncbi:MAG: hypothetical protein WAT23_11130 [Chromatiaceae bacterium]
MSLIICFRARRACKVKITKRTHFNFEQGCPDSALIEEGGDATQAQDAVYRWLLAAPGCGSIEALLAVV